MRLADLSARQRANARVIFDAAVPFEDSAPGAVKAALMAAADESSFLRYANDGSYALDQSASIWRWYAKAYGKDYPTLRTDQDIYRAHMRESLGFPYDKVAGSALTTKDSAGHYQQREMYGYGPLSDLMDPVESTRIFLRGVPGQPTKVRNWSRADKKGADIAAQIQWVQGSEYPTGDNYRPLEQVADELIESFGGLPTTKDGLDMATVQDVSTAVADQVGAVETRLNQKLDASVKDLAAYIVSNDVMRAQAKAILAFDPGPGPWADQIATQTKLLDGINRKLQWLIDQQPQPAPAELASEDPER